MITLTQDTPTGGDCTAGYKVQFSKTCTVREFIEEVLKRNPREWGEFKLKNFGIRTEYREGRLVKQNFTDALLDSKITKAYAAGGWGLMDYYLTIELKDESSFKPEKVQKAMVFSKTETPTQHYLSVGRVNNWKHSTDCAMK